MNYTEIITKYKEFEKFSSLDYVAVSKFLRRSKNLDDYYDFIKENATKLDLYTIAENKNISWDMMSLLIKYDDRK